MAVTAQALAEFETARVDEYGDDPKSYKHIYWRRPEGAIIVAPGWDSEIANFVKLGFTPLPQYGKFFLEQPGWAVLREPYREILRRGGAHEFTVAQLLELGWHRRAPYRGVEFPQLEGVEIPEHPCPTCRKVFLSEADLARHESVAHTEASRNQQLARNLANAQKDVTGPLAEVLKAMVETLARVTDTQAAILARLDAVDGGRREGKGRDT